jgi:hypothetical protein
MLWILKHFFGIRNPDLQIRIQNPDLRINPLDRDPTWTFFITNDKIINIFPLVYLNLANSKDP